MFSNGQEKKEIIELSLKRIGTIFNVRYKDLNLVDRFGVDLEASFVSDFNIIRDRHLRMYF